MSAVLQLSRRAARVLVVAFVTVVVTVLSLAPALGHHTASYHSDATHWHGPYKYVINSGHHYTGGGIHHQSWNIYENDVLIQTGAAHRHFCNQPLQPCANLAD